MAFAGGQPVKKNAEFLLIFPIYDSDGDLVTGAAALDSEVSKDGGAFIDCTNEAIEIGTSGIYKLTLTPTEMNADVVAIITKTTTEDAKTTPTVIYTSANQIEAMRGTDDAITSLEAITGDKDSYKATGFATEIKQDIIDDIVDNIKSYLVDAGRIDALLDTIIGKTNNLPADPASEAKQDVIDGIVDDIKADLVDGGRLDLLIDAIKARTDINATETKQNIIDTIVDAIKVETDKLNNMIEADEGDFRYTQNALEQAPVGEGFSLEAIADAVWNELKAGHTIPASYGDFLDVKISTVGAAAGAGAITWVYTLTDSITGYPIADADVWVSTDKSGVPVIASGKTDQYGKVTFYLDVGEIFVFRQKSGWDFVNPDEETVS